LTKRYAGLLPASAQKTLETMFFAMPDAVSTTPPGGGEVIGRRPRLSGSARRPVWASSVSDPVARTLAANFIGCDESADLRSDQVAGVIAELANMICGAVLSELESDAHFDLARRGLPCRRGRTRPGFCPLGRSPFPASNFPGAPSSYSSLSEEPS